MCELWGVIWTKNTARYGEYTVMIMFAASGVDATKGDGDVFRPDNQEAFQKFVMESTNGKGVHFVMADGVSIRNR